MYKYIDKHYKLLLNQNCKNNLKKTWFWTSLKKWWSIIFLWETDCNKLNSTSCSLVDLIKFGQRIFIFFLMIDIKNILDINRKNLKSSNWKKIFAIYPIFFCIWHSHHKFGYACMMHFLDTRKIVNGFVGGFLKFN